MSSTVRLVLITALRDRLFASLLGLETIVLVVSLFLGGAMIFEAKASAVVFAAGSARVAVILGLAIFVAFHVQRLYDTREIEAILSRTISRGGFVASYWLGLLAVAFTFVIPVALFLAIFHLSLSGTVWWSLSLVLEAGIVLAFALFAGVILERAIPTIFATAGFYGLARLVSFLLGIATKGQQNGVNRVSNPAFDAISMVMPRLDLFSQTSWLIYGPAPGDKLFLIPLQFAVYVPLLLLMTSFDLERKEF